ncbi:MAG: DUF1016 family protein [Chitinophagaceae bacterium]|nr:MAG: DUF1016 family protein [Chitinophagaceae bacterium]
MVVSLSRQLTEEFDSGWGTRQLHYYMHFTEVFPKIEIVHTLYAKLSWFHIREIMYIEKPLKRDFYIEMCRYQDFH